MDRNGSTFAELADMHLAYGAAVGNAEEARRIYHERFPNRRLPGAHMFVNNDQRLRDTGSFSQRQDNVGAPRRVRTPEFDEHVLNQFEQTPSTSTRKVAHEIGVDRRLIWNVLNENNMHPYRLQKVQALSEDDYPLRTVFSNWFLGQRAQDPRFPSLVLFTDEATFTREGVFNNNNNHQWSYENPHATHTHGHQQRFSVNLWAGIVGD